MREAMEETGLRDLEIVRFLGEHVKDRSDVVLDEVHHRFFFHLRCNEEAPDRWQHYETDASDIVDGKPVFPLFEFFGVQLPDGVPPLIADHDYFMWKLLPGDQREEVTAANTRMRSAYDAIVSNFSERTRLGLPSRPGFHELVLRQECFDETRQAVSLQTHISPLTEH